MRNSIGTAITGVLLLLACLTVSGQENDFESLLQFEKSREGEVLGGWGGGPPETVHFDSTVVHSGSGAVRLERNAASPHSFSTITKQLPISFEGKSLVLRGFLRTEGVTKFAGLWMREDGSSGTLQFNNMQDQGVRGTTEWKEYTVRLPLDPDARSLYFGVLVVGEGTVWADDLQLLVDGKPLAETPERVIEPTVLEMDHAFDSGSGIEVTSLTERQIEHVAVLGKVWGFLKYHHSSVTAGKVHWDYELFRVLPAILEATDREAFGLLLSQWFERLGVPERRAPFARPPEEDVHLIPRLGWIEDAKLLDPEHSRHLRRIYTLRFSGIEQFYVSQVKVVRNPVFDHELAYPDQQPPDAGFRILALLRLWNCIEYWFPYRDLIDDWDAVLPEFLPRLVAAESWDAYRLELLALIARIEDTHANLRSELEVRPPRGSCFWPVALRFIEGYPTVVAYTDEAHGKASGLKIGDVLKAVDGKPIAALIEDWSPYYSASNQTTRLRDIARFLPRGDCGESTLSIERRGVPQAVVVHRLADIDPKPIPHDRPGETFQILSPEVAYLKLSSVRVSEVAEYMRRAAGTRGLVIDIRNYPSEFVVFPLGSQLVRKPTAFARSTVGDLDNPGAFTWNPPLTLHPQAPGYRGKVTILVDEVSGSQAEYTAMALRAGPRAVVVGSTTAGADGNVSPIPLPGGLRTTISGIGVFYPDRTPTQQVGIVPDIEARPTVAGIREGRDEVLEAALRHILGPDADEEMIRRIATRLP